MLGVAMGRVHGVAMRGLGWAATCQDDSSVTSGRSGPAAGAELATRAHHAVGDDEVHAACLDPCLPQPLDLALDESHVGLPAVQGGRGVPREGDVGERGGAASGRAGVVHARRSSGQRGGRGTSLGAGCSPACSPACGSSSPGRACWPARAGNGGEGGGRQAEQARRQPEEAAGSWEAGLVAGVRRPGHRTEPNNKCGGGGGGGGLRRRQEGVWAGGGHPGASAAPTCASVMSTPVTLPASPTIAAHT